MKVSKNIVSEKVKRRKNSNKTTKIPKVKSFNSERTQRKHPKEY